MEILVSSEWSFIIQGTCKSGNYSKLTQGVIPINFSFLQHPVYKRTENWECNLKVISSVKTLQFKWLLTPKASVVVKKISARTEHHESNNLD